MVSKNGHIEMAMEVMNRIGSEKIKNHLVRLQVSKARKSLQTAITEFTEVKNELISEYAVDGAVTPQVPGFDKFTASYNELTNAEVEFTPVAMPPLVLDMFEMSVDDVDILLLVGLLDDESDEEPTLEAVG